MRGIGSRLIAFASVSSLLAACDPAASYTETERARCEAWASTLFRPSRADTEETALGLTAQYDIFRAACPGIEPGGDNGTDH